MPGYFLLRNQQLVDKYCDPTGLGAGHLHDLGQAGDVLVCLDKDRMSRFHWLSAGTTGNKQCWCNVATSKFKEAHYKTLILLQG